MGELEARLRVAEVKVLKCLTKEFKSTELIAEEALGSEAYIRSVNVHIASIRNKLGLQSFILNQRKKGYRINPSINFRTF